MITVCELVFAQSYRVWQPWHILCSKTKKCFQPPPQLWVICLFTEFCFVPFSFLFTVEFWFMICHGFYAFCYCWKPSCCWKHQSSSLQLVSWIRLFMYVTSFEKMGQKAFISVFLVINTNRKGNQWALIWYKFQYSVLCSKHQSKVAISE